MTSRVIAMRGPNAPLRIKNLSNYEAGLAFLGVVNQVYPGIRIAQLHQLAYGNKPETMGRKWWEKALAVANPVEQFHNVSGVVGGVKDGIGDVLKDSFDATADAGGSFVRLFADEKVINAANSSYESFTSSGGIGGAVVGDWTGGGGGGSDSSGGGVQAAGKSLFDFIVNLGASAKSKATQAASADTTIPGGVLPWAVGGVVVLWALPRLFGRRR